MNVIISYQHCMCILCVFLLIFFSNKEFLKMYPGTSASTQFSWNLKLRLVNNVNKINTDGELRFAIFSNILVVDWKVNIIVL